MAVCLFSHSREGRHIFNLTESSPSPCFLRWKELQRKLSNPCVEQSPRCAPDSFGLMFFHHTIEAIPADTVRGPEPIAKASDTPVLTEERRICSVQTGRHGNAPAPGLLRMHGFFRALGRALSLPDQRLHCFIPRSSFDTNNRAVKIQLVDFLRIHGIIHAPWKLQVSTSCLWRGNCPRRPRLLVSA
jgi:hypothetical protein